MFRLLQLFVYKAIWPMVAILGTSLITLYLVLWGVSVVEHRLGRPTVFEMQVLALDAPLWVLLLAGMGITNGITMSRWALVSASVIKRGVSGGYELAVPFPVGKMTAVNILYIGASVFLFYAARRTVW